MYPYVHCSIIYNSKDLEAAQVPISRWVDRKAVVHLHNGILLCKKNIKKEENLTFCDSMDLEIIMLGEISQSEKDKYRMIPFICGL